ncbi:MAG: Bax inhibitor-1/YccA family protein [Parvibaculum sp.]|uniref:Bax inhibitor-1/YccA family protein n=1 Tax=Parvibaculum sp. TaxID=2024848 RepID=UPI001D81EC1F|nr:Bax inhibitor-1/YccA family protein [Parvibaculum sp.]MBX3489611.1 Bax inhibitor-1/YccA family protein [Parvibaculum sp.]MBX3494662.1 Bax inhibitor-1/YccA family protein [Parvibaculum sp.]MCW5726431.1 Bax inhibitor-1/YccA family protein [Parvibaculum sp.]
MANYDQERLHQVELGRRADMAVDEGLRSYMLSVYNYMAMALALTGLVALGAYNMAVVETPAGLAFSEFGQAIYASPLRWVVILAPLAFIFFLSFRVQAMSLFAVQTTFWLFAGVMGLSLSSIFLVYTGESITTTFFVTAAAFGSLSLYGYTTKRDLTGMGSFLFMGLIGVILAMVVNIFLQSSALQFAVSVIGVLVFAGLTAYDTQRIKGMYYEGDSVAASGKKAVMGALSLYLDFVNMFMFLLQFLGSQRS